MIRRTLFLATLAVVVAFILAPSAGANWGPGKCGIKAEPVNEHCYAFSERNTYKYGGVLASIDYVDTTGMDVKSEIFVDNEQWISFEDQGYSGWIETGQAGEHYLGCCEVHPFYAQEQKGAYEEDMAVGTFPLNSYNHYVLFDANVNGIFHVYWGCCEVHTYGGWPKYLTEQQAGIEAATEVRPENWGRQEVWDSDGGEWTAWNGDKWRRWSGICMESNKESPDEGNIMWGTVGGPGDEECK